MINNDKDLIAAARGAQAHTNLGKRLLELRNRIVASGERLLSSKDIEQEALDYASLSHVQLKRSKRRKQFFADASVGFCLGIACGAMLAVWYITW